MTKNAFKVTWRIFVTAGYSSEYQARTKRIYEFMKCDSEETSTSRFEIESFLVDAAQWESKNRKETSMRGKKLKCEKYLKIVL